MSLYRIDHDYLAYWSLDSSPFVHRDKNRFFSGTAQQNALARIQQFVESGRSVAILTGVSGCGTTQLLQYLSMHAGLGDTAVEMVLSQGMPRANQITRTLWLVDANSANESERFLRSAPDVSILIGATAETTNKLLTRLREKPTIIELTRMSACDARAYVDYSIRMVGGTRPIFTESAISQLHEYSAGRIREFAFFAEHALRESWVHHEDKIGTGTIDRVAVGGKRAA